MWIDRVPAKIDQFCPKGSKVVRLLSGAILNTRPGSVCLNMHSSVFKFNVLNLIYVYFNNQGFTFF